MHVHSLVESLVLGESLLIHIGTILYRAASLAAIALGVLAPAAITSQVWAGGAGAGAVVYVDDHAPPGGDGLTWAGAFSDLQSALDLAGNPKNRVSEVHIAGGVYRPTHRTDGSSVLTDSIAMRASPSASPTPN